MIGACPSFANQGAAPNLARLLSLFSLRHETISDSRNFHITSSQRIKASQCSRLSGLCKLSFDEDRPRSTLNHHGSHRQSRDLYDDDTGERSRPLCDTDDCPDSRVPASSEPSIFGEAFTIGDYDGFLQVG